MVSPVPPNGDPGKFLIDGKAARAIHRFDGWHVPISLGWFSGGYDPPVIQKTPFHWYMLGCYLTWHLRRAWAPLTFTDEHPPDPANPVAPARRSPWAQAKASYQHDAAGQPCRSFRGLLEHLATLTRNQVRFAGTRTTVPMLAEPTSAQREAFRLLGVPVPLALK